MPTLPFGEYRPDLSDLDGQHTRSILNVVPRGDGYGPFNVAEAFTDALAAVCRGYFYAHNSDGTITIFAGSSTKLYMMSNTDFSWSDVSVGAGSYAALDGDANWAFAQFGQYVIACQANAAVQVWDLTASSAFANLAGSPPNSAFVSVVNGFLVLSGLASNPRRIQWSGLNATTTWTSGVNSSDYQDLPDGGNVGPVVGGEFGVILQDFAIRRMTFSPGSETIFDIQRIGKDIGIQGYYSACNAGERVFFLTPKGFMQSSGAGELLPIGEEKVNRTFFAEFDAGNSQLLQAAADPNTNTVLWVYKTSTNPNATFNKGLLYNYLLQRWAPVEIEGEYLAALASPGLTMENLDAIASGAMAITGAVSASGLIKLTVASTSTLSTGNYKTISGVLGTTEANGTWAITVVNGTTFTLDGSTFANAYVSGGIVGGSLDDLTFSLDGFSTSSLPNLSMCGTAHKIGFFSGDALEATLETPEQSGDGQRIKVKGFFPITDATDVRGRISKRELLSAALTYTAESTMNAQGYVCALRDTRYTRAKVRIPSGTNWSFASGVKPDAGLTGRR